MPCTLYLLCGPPGSGKSTVAKHLAIMEDARIVCPDTIREQFPKWRNPVVFLKAHHEMRQALKAGQSVVFDATNVFTPWRAAVLAASRPYTPQLICIRLTTSLEQCLAWHRQRQEQGLRRDLSTETLVHMHQLLERHPPLISEGFDAVILFDPTSVPQTPSS